MTMALNDPQRFVLKPQREGGGLFLHRSLYLLFLVACQKCNFYSSAFLLFNLASLNSF